MKMNAAYRQATGRHIRVVSGFRTMERQTELYNGYVARRPGYNLAARPGTSNHQVRHRCFITMRHLCWCESNLSSFRGRMVKHWIWALPETLHCIRG